MRMRQVHLDFHTSELIGNIAGEFDSEQFTSTLRAAHVDLVTVFARCHHGMLSLPQLTLPRTHPPHLKNNLLVDQVNACRDAQINAPVYITVQWDYYTALHHPEWLATDANGNPFECEPARSTVV
jgi:hypothetical protein